jgi:hypothetical protein
MIFLVWRMWVYVNPLCNLSPAALNKRLLNLLRVLLLLIILVHLLELGTSEVECKV